MFWRTQQQQEIDYIEEENGQFNSFEFKWNAKKAHVKQPKSFSDAYTDSTFTVVTPDNIDSFIL